MISRDHHGSTHAGAVVYRGRPASPEFLLVSAANNPSELVLAKGHIEHGEDSRLAACREVLEEAGVTVELPDSEELGTVSYSVRDETVRAVYYLARYLSAPGGSEKRTLKWMSVQLAEASVAHDETRRMLEKASARLAEISPTTSSVPLS